MYCFHKTCNGRCTIRTLQGPPKPSLAPTESPAAAAATAKTSAESALIASKYSKLDNTGRKKRKHDIAKVKFFDWEPNVTAECRPSDVLVPFTYIRDRIYPVGDGAYLVERRCEGRCNCKRSLELSLTAGNSIIL